MSSLILAAGMAGFAVAAQAPATNQPNSNTISTQDPNNNNGYSKDMVRKAQEKLKKDGDYTGNVDGMYGPETRAAIEKYQQSENLKVNGHLDSRTCAKLGINK